MVTFFLLSLMAFAEDGRSDDDRAKTLFESGVIFYEEANYEEAIRFFEHAYDLSGRHELLFNIAAAYERLGAYEEAINALSIYRQYAATEEQDLLQRRIENLGKLQEKQQTNTAATKLPEDLVPTNQDKPPSKDVSAEQPDTPKIQTEEGGYEASNTTNRLNEGLFNKNSLIMYSSTTAALAVGLTLWSKQQARLLEDQCFSLSLDASKSEYVCPASAMGMIKTERSTAIGADISWFLSITGAVLTVYSIKKSQSASSAEESSVQPDKQ